MRLVPCRWHGFFIRKKFTKESLRIWRIFFGRQRCVSSPIVCLSSSYVYRNNKIIPMCTISCVSKSLSFGEIDLEFGRLLPLVLKLLLQKITVISSCFSIDGLKSGLPSQRVGPRREFYTIAAISSRAILRVLWLLNFSVQYDVLSTFWAKQCRARNKFLRAGALANTLGVAFQLH